MVAAASLEVAVAGEAVLLGISEPAAEAGKVNEGSAESAGREPVLDGTGTGPGAVPVGKPVGLALVRKPEEPTKVGWVPLDGTG